MGHECVNEMASKSCIYFFILDLSWFVLPQNYVAPKSNWCNKLLIDDKKFFRISIIHRLLIDHLQWSKVTNQLLGEVVLAFVCNPVALRVNLKLEIKSESDNHLSIPEYPLLFTMCHLLNGWHRTINVFLLLFIIYDRLVQPLLKENFTACVRIYQHLAETFL